MNENTQIRITELLYTNDKDVIDCELLEAKNIDSIHSKLYFCGVELKGGIESKSAECFFGEENLNYNTGLDESKVIYYLQGKEEKQNLRVFLNNSVLTILNYSLIQNSLNIKLECLSKQSLEYNVKFSLSQKKVNNEFVILQELIPH